MKHSKGPWTTHIGYDSDGEFVDYIVNAHGNVIAETIACNPPEQNRIDARLMVASPELLDALKYALNLVKEYAAPPAPRNDLKPILAAIAKAEGRG